MHYELVSRALAYVSCFSTMSLLMTSMAIAAINVGRAHDSFCAPFPFLSDPRKIRRWPRGSPSLPEARHLHRLVHAYLGACRRAVPKSNRYATSGCE